MHHPTLINLILLVAKPHSVIIFLCSILAFILIYLIYKQAKTVLTQRHEAEEPQYLFSIDQRYNADRSFRQQEIDCILEKIHLRGMSSLTKDERQTLHDYSQK